MRAHTVIGGDGLNLHVQEAGNPNGKAILFIHGFSQCGLAWTKQLNSELARTFRLVAMDIRGHGLSDKPRDAYGESKLWADDVRAVIEALELDGPVLSGWSYGGTIVSDYVGHYGEGDIAGTHWVGAVSRLGEPLVEGGFLGADFLGALPGLYSEKAEESGMALQAFLRLNVHEEPSREELYFFLGYNCLVPPYVRQGLFARNLNNDSVVKAMRKPLLVSYGEEDRIVSPTMAAHIAGLAKQAAVSAYPGIGHMTFWEAPERFNRELAEFRAAV